MTELLIFLGCSVAYLAIGFRVATIPFARREFARNMREYRILLRPGKADEWRREALAFGLPLALVWPFYLGWRAVARRASTYIPETDPETAQRLAQQERRIAELERELDIRKGRS